MCDVAFSWRFNEIESFLRAASSSCRLSLGTNVTDVCTGSIGTDIYNLAVRAQSSLKLVDHCRRDVNVEILIGGDWQDFLHVMDGH